MTVEDQTLFAAIQRALYPKETCTGCEGRFQRNEQIYKDYDNKNYCEICFKERYEE